MPERNSHAAVVRAELSRVVGSQAFARALRSQSLLRYLVEAALRTPPIAPKEYAIAIDVFGRAPDYDPDVDATVRVEAGRLRSRLRDFYAAEGGEPEVTISIPKGGYAVVFTPRATEGRDRDGEVDPGFAGVGDVPGAQPGRPPEAWLPEAGTLVGDPVLEDGGRVGPGRRGWVTAIAVVLGVAGLVLMAWELVHQRRLRAASAIHSMAVLPLRNLSGSADGSYLAAGMTDELNTELARIPHLRVISHESVGHAQLEGLPLRQIGRQLGVDTLVEGSVVRAGDKVRINAELTDVRSDRQLWAAGVEGDAKDLLALERDVAREIASHARLAFVPGIAEHPSPEAYDLYLRARYFLDQRDAVRSVDYFQRAVAADPSFASAYGGLAEALEAMRTLGVEKEKDSLSRALASAHQAIALDAGNGPAYSALGTIELTDLWDWPGAEQDLLRGMQLSPEDSFPVTMYGLLLDATDRREEAVVTMRQAAVMDPLSFFVTRNLGASLYFARRYDEAMEQFDRARELQPGRPQILENWVSWTYEAKGMRDEAVRYDLASLQGSDLEGQVKQLQRSYERDGWRGYWMSRLASEVRRPENACTAFYVAADSLRLEEPERAVAALEEAMTQHCFWMEMIHVDPRFDALRGNPRFVALERRMGAGSAERR